MGGTRRVAMIAALLALAAVAGAALGGSADEGVETPGGSAPEKVRVFYPRGDCSTGVIEVEVFDRTAHRWRSHPDHPRVRAGTCQAEDPGILLDQIRIRCVDPSGAALASDWRVGFDVFRPREAPACDQES